MKDIPPSHGFTFRNSWTWWWWVQERRDRVINCRVFNCLNQEVKYVTLLTGHWPVLITLPSQQWDTQTRVFAETGEAIIDETQHCPPHLSRWPEGILRVLLTHHSWVFSHIFSTQVVCASLRSIKSFQNCPFLILLLNREHESVVYCPSDPFCPYTFNANRCLFSSFIWVQPIMGFCILLFT